MSDSIEQAIEKLSWNAPVKDQKEAIAFLAANIGCEIHRLVMPKNSKEYWDNAAIVLQSVNKDLLAQKTPFLLEWIKDTNWPGAETIFNLVLTLDQSKLIPHLRDAKILAIKDNDEEWLEKINEVDRRTNSSGI